MSTIFQSNWDTTSILDSVWTEQGNISLALTTTNTNVFRGARSLRLNTVISNEYQNDILVPTTRVSSYPNLGVRFALNVNTLRLIETTICSVSATGWAELPYNFPIWTMGVYYDVAKTQHYINIWYVGGETLIPDQVPPTYLTTQTSTLMGSSIPISTNTWYQIEVLYISGTSIAWRLWNNPGTILLNSYLKSTGVVSLSGQNGIASWRGVAVLDGIGFFNNGNLSKGSLIMQFDSLIVDNATFPGPSA
jgi:hypothetical protein